MKGGSQEAKHDQKLPIGQTRGLTSRFNSVEALVDLILKSFLRAWWRKSLTGVDSRESETSETVEVKCNILFQRNLP